MILCVFAVSVSSCVLDKTAAFPEEQGLVSHLSIDDARVFFDEVGKNLHPGPVGYTRSEPPFHSFAPDWSKALYSVFLGEEVIEVPFEGLGFIIDHKTPEGENWETDPADSAKANTSVKLIAGLNEWGEIVYRMLYITSFGSWAGDRGLEAAEVTIRDTEDSFSGSFLLYETTGEFIAGYVFAAGEATHTISLPGLLTGAGSLSGGECVYHYMNWHWCYYFPGTTVLNPDNCIYLGRELLYVLCVYKDDGGIGGGGVAVCTECRQTPCACACEDCGENPCVCVGQDYDPKTTDHLFRFSFPHTMSKQANEYLCVPSAMAYVNGLYGGSNDWEYYALNYMQEYGGNIYDYGVEGANMTPFLQTHFHTQAGGDPASYLSRNYPVFLTYNNGSHAVIVVGCRPPNYLIYMDPAFGRLRIATYSELGDRSMNWTMALTGKK